MAGEVGRLVLLAQIMAEVSARTSLLEDTGKQAGLDWLKQHGGLIFPGRQHWSKCNKPISLEELLLVWFAQVSPPRAVLLYRLFMNEVARWHRFDEVPAAESHE